MPDVSRVCCTYRHSVLRGPQVIFDRTGSCSLEEAEEFLRTMKMFSPDLHYIFVVRDEAGRYLRTFYAGRARVVHIPLLALGFTELRTALAFGRRWETVEDARYLPVRIHHIHQPKMTDVKIVSIGKSRRSEQTKPRWQS